MHSMPKSIDFLFPHPAAGPTGGYKVVYEYANRLANDGYGVHIVYSGVLPCLFKSECFLYPSSRTVTPVWLL